MMEMQTMVYYYSVLNKLGILSKTFSGQEIVKPPEPMIRIGSVSVKGSETQETVPPLLILIDFRLHIRRCFK